VKLNNPTIGIIGGTGRMGGWLASLLETQSFRTVKVGRERAEDIPALAQTCPVIVVSVPINDTLEVIRRIGPLMAEDGLLMDLTSVKKAPLAEMMKWSRCRVVGAHPLFGPEGPGQDHGRVILCPGRGAEGLAWVRALFERGGIRVLVMDPESHDRLMGMIQGVQHFVTLSLALTLCRCGLDLGNVRQCATTTFRAFLARISAMTSQSPQLFRSLLMDNAHAPPFMEAYLRSAEELCRLVEEKDREAFDALFCEVRGRFSSEMPDGGPGLAESGT
jgi:prephenate dehydrogenase